MKISFATLFALACAMAASDARADDDAPNFVLLAQHPVTLPQVLTMPETLRMFRERGFDMLLAEAAAMHAEGDVDVAGRVPNPQLTGGVGYSFNILPSQAAWSWSASLTDSTAIFDLLTGKHSLRARAAHAALLTARDHRASVQAALEVSVKQAYVQIALARLQVQFTEQQTKSLQGSLDITRLRYPAVIDESDLARVEVQKLEADQAVTRSKGALRTAQASLALLLGVRGEVPDFDVDRGALAYRIPTSLANATEASLIEIAKQHRPEIVESRHAFEAAEASLSVEKRRVFPDITLGAFVGGQQSSSTNAISPYVAGGTISANLPIFYQQQGEVRRASGDLAGYAINQRRVEAQLALDVTIAFSAMNTSRVQVDRMLGGEIDSATRQRDVLQKKFPGQADLNDFLDAERTYITVQLEYLQFVASYWSAVFALERATGTDLR